MMEDLYTHLFDIPVKYLQLCIIISLLQIEIKIRKYYVFFKYMFSATKAIHWWVNLFCELFPPADDKELWICYFKFIENQDYQSRGKFLKLITKPVFCMCHELLTYIQGVHWILCLFLKILWFFWTLPVLLQRWFSTCLVFVHTLTPREGKYRKDRVRNIIK